MCCKIISIHTISPLDLLWKYILWCWPNNLIEKKFPWKGFLIAGLFWKFVSVNEIVPAPHVPVGAVAWVPCALGDVYRPQIFLFLLV